MKKEKSVLITENCKEFDLENIKKEVSNELLDFGFKIPEVKSMLSKRDKARKYRLMKKESITGRFPIYGLHNLNNFSTNHNYYEGGYKNRGIYIHRKLCPHCETTSAICYGKRYNKIDTVQKYKCLFCDKYFCEPSKTRKITNGIELRLIIACYCDGKSFRQIKKIFEDKFNKKIHHSTIGRRLQKTKIYQEYKGVSNTQNPSDFGIKDTPLIIV